MTPPLRIVIVDDHPLFRAGVARSLEECESCAVVAEGGSCEDAVRLAREHAPDMMLLDISMPGGGIAAAAEIAEASPDIAIAMLTVSESSEDILSALKAGARGYILKGIGSAALIEIVAAMARGESYVSPSLAARLLTEMKEQNPDAESEDLLDRLTPREAEILRLVATGLSNKEVALKLDLQEKTVKHHMTGVLSKLRVRNRTEAAMVLRGGSDKHT